MNTTLPESEALACVSQESLEWLRLRMAVDAITMKTEEEREMAKYWATLANEALEVRRVLPY